MENHLITEMATVPFSKIDYICIEKNDSIAETLTGQRTYEVKIYFRKQNNWVLGSRESYLNDYVIGADCLEKKKALELVKAYGQALADWEIARKGIAV